MPRCPASLRSEPTGGFKVATVASAASDGVTERGQSGSVSSGSLGRRALTLMYGFDPVSLGLGYECISHQTAPPSQLKSCQSWLQRQPRPLAADRTEGLAANRQPVDA